MLMVPPNYGMVECGIHRSSEPRPIHFPFVQTLGLRTCVVLSDCPRQEFLSWLETSGICVVRPAECPGGLRDPGISETDVTSIVSLLLRSEHHPLLVTCSMGRYRTGIVVGCLRKLQRWTLTTILEEYRRFVNGKSRQDNEEFLETFDTELVHVPLDRNGHRMPPLYCDA